MFVNTSTYIFNSQTSCYSNSTVNMRGGQCVLVFITVGGEVLRVSGFISDLHRLRSGSRGHAVAFRNSKINLF